MKKNNFLNVGIIQQRITENTAENLANLKDSVDRIMMSYHKPELVVGVETITPGYSTTIPGELTEFFGAIAKKYGIYFIPGSISEKDDSLPPGKQYNTAVVFNPDGELIGKYRKIAPWHPAEDVTIPGGNQDNYLVFDIPEKDTKVGVQICYDINFPEISRNLTLMGAEVLVKLTMDPEELYKINDHFHVARAVENQAYLVCTNGTGQFLENHLYGHSMIVSPEGERLWEASQEPCICTTTIDLSVVRRCREYGSLFMDHYIKHVREFDIKRMYNDNIADAPVYKNLGPAPIDGADYRKRINDEFGLIGYGASESDFVFKDYSKDVKEFLKKNK